MNSPSRANATMIRCQFFIAPDQVAFLTQLHKDTDHSRASIVREAIRFYASQKLGIKLAPEP